MTTHYLFVYWISLSVETAPRFSKSHQRRQIPSHLILLLGDCDYDNILWVKFYHWTI